MQFEKKKYVESIMQVHAVEKQKSEDQNLEHLIIHSIALYTARVEKISCWILNCLQEKD